MLASFYLASFSFFSEVIHVNFRIYWPQQKNIELQMLQGRNKAKEFNISSGPNCRALYIHKVRSGAMKVLPRQYYFLLRVIDKMYISSLSGWNLT